MSKTSKTVIIIAGPTAVGKTSVAIQVARYFGTDIISADSRQCFYELNIGVARPSEEELALVKHYFIASHSIQDKVTASTFETYALEKASQIFQSKDVVVMTGGTGLYIKAFEEGMDAIPDIPDQLRQEIINEYKAQGLSWLQAQIRMYDPVFAENGEMQNPQRIMRALEVVKATGNSLFSYRDNLKQERPFDIVKIALELPREQLIRNIDTRVDLMMTYGLEQEVKALQPWQELNALQTVGYKELFEHFNGRINLQQAVSDIKTHTRQYAKRQMTWFRKDSEYQWFPPNAGEVIRYLEKVC